MTDVRRLLAVLGGLAALVAALLGTLQIDSSRKSDRAAAEGSRLAVEIFEDLTSAGLALNLELSVIREQFELETDADSVELLTADGSESGLGAVALADKRAASRLKSAGSTMIGKPLGLESGPALIAGLEALKEQLDGTVARQNAAIAEADRFARRSGGASRGLLLVAMAGALFTLAGSIRERRPAQLALGTGALVLVASVVTGVLALLA